MTVGNAEQLVATVGVEDTVPYNFRTAGGSADIGDRLVDKLVGGTVCWNQLVDERNASSNTKHGVTFQRVSGMFAFNVSGTLNDVTTGDRNAYIFNSYNDNVVISGHKYLLTNTSKYYCAYVYAYQSGAFTITGNRYNVSNQTGIVFTANNSGQYMISLHAGTNIALNTEINETIYINVVDLTQMFGSTIADYIYSLEQATAGAGVAWFRHLFPKPYYAYNVGELMSVQAASHITRGFNAWDKENQPLYNGSWDSVGGTINVCVDGYIRVVPGMQYEFAHKTGSGIYQGQYFRFYDANKNHLTSITSYSTGSITFTVPENACYVRFMFYHSNGITPSQIYAMDVCLHLSWDGERDGEYEPYTEHVYPLDDSLTLRGIPKLDASNNLYYDGDTYESDGTVTRRYGVVDLGTLTWQKSQSGLFYTNKLQGVTKNSVYGVIANAVSPIYEMMTSSITGPDGTNPSPDKRIAIGTSGQVYVNDLSFTDAAEYKTAMSGVMFVYELAEPTTESADPFQNPQIVDDFGTEEYVDAGVTAATPTRDVAIPVGHETTYQANLRAKLEMAPDSPSDGDGDYIVRQTNGTNEYAKLVIPTELPTNPTTDGTYHLKATVSDGTTTLTWEADT